MATDHRSAWQSPHVRRVRTYLVGVIIATVAVTTLIGILSGSISQFGLVATVVFLAILYWGELA